MHDQEYMQSRVYEYEGIPYQWVSDGQVIPNPFPLEVPPSWEKARDQLGLRLYRHVTCGHEQTALPRSETDCERCDAQEIKGAAGEADSGPSRKRQEA